MIPPDELDSSPDSVRLPPTRKLKLGNTPVCWEIVPCMGFACICGIVSTSMSKCTSRGEHTMTSCGKNPREGCRYRKLPLQNKKLPLQNFGVHLGWTVVIRQRSVFGYRAATGLCVSPTRVRRPAGGVKPTRFGTLGHPLPVPPPCTVFMRRSGYLVLIGHR